LIGGILIDNRQAKNYFRVFYTRRAFRILPIYMATVAVGFAPRLLRTPISCPDGSAPPSGRRM